MKMGLREANQNFSKVIKAIKAGKIIVLTERGEPIATIRPEEDRPGADPVVVLTNGFWRTYFGANANIIGQKIRIDGNLFTVVGILATDPEYFGLARVWIPLALRQEANARSTHFLSAVARLKDGVTIGQAQSEMDTIASRSLKVCAWS